jgi:hypothetical protein
MKSATWRWTAAALFAAAVLFVALRYRETSVADSGAPGESCIADSIDTLRLASTIPTCSKNDWLCRGNCLAGKAESCLGLAYASETAKPDDAIRFYHQACLLGLANACTNYAANIWLHTHSGRQLTCARRTFDKACAAKEPFACGMVGRIMLESTSPPAFAEGRKYLEAACDKVGGFPCRVLAKHFESGKLGPYPPGLVRTLLSRACAGGDPDACGEPPTASQTFR